MLQASKNDTKFQIHSYSSHITWAMGLHNTEIVILDFSVYLLFETLNMDLCQFRKD